MERPTPRVFHYSLDWRFLLPIADPGKLLVVFEEDADFRHTLEQAGIPRSNQLTFSDIKKTAERSTPSMVLPFGMPAEWMGARQENQTEFFSSARQWMNPGGYFLVGFNNTRGVPPRNQTKYCPSTPQRVVYQLRQAGFKSIKIFGAFPDLSIPEYIFELNAASIRFALSHRLKRKPVLLYFLQRVSRIVGWVSISTFLPCYFVVAQDEQR